MHPKAMENMNKKLRHTLENCKVARMWPDFASYEQNLNAFAEEVIKHTKEWMTVTGVYSLFVTEVTTFLSKNFPLTIEREGNLKELIGDDEIENLTNRIIDYIESIPRKYIFHFPLPGITDLGNGHIALSENIYFRTYVTKEDIPGNHPGGLSGMLLTQMQPGRLYLCIVEKGYAGWSIYDSATLRAISKFKQLIHLGRFRGIFGLRKTFSLTHALLGRQPLPDIKVIAIDSAEPDRAPSITELPLDLSLYIEKIKLLAENKQYQVAKERGDEEVQKFLINVFRDPINLITVESKDAIPIRTAIEWAFEASINENETVAFLQICIGLEAILGVGLKTEEPLTKTLADRCAYLIGGDIEGRNKIRETFIKLYGLRSNLVHGRAVHLNANERHYLDRGKTILDIVIYKEIKNLEQNAD